MNYQEIQLQVLDEERPLNYDDHIDTKKNRYKDKSLPFFSRLFFLWTLDIMRLSNKGQLKKDAIRKSTLFTSSKNKNQLREDFVFIKELWEGKDNKNGFNTWKICPIIFTIARFNLLYFIRIISLSFFVHGLKMSLVFYKRKIIKLFFKRDHYNSKKTQIIK